LIERRSSHVNDLNLVQGDQREAVAMSYSKLIHPKKKGRMFASKDAPLPVPIASITRKQCSEKQWLYYTGNLLGNQVIVHHSGDMNFMYKMVRLFIHDNMVNWAHPTDLGISCSKYFDFMSKIISFRIKNKC
jgi:hypothetical protein